MAEVETVGAEAAEGDAERQRRRPAVARRPVAAHLLGEAALAQAQHVSRRRAVHHVPGPGPSNIDDIIKPLNCLLSI